MESAYLFSNGIAADVVRGVLEHTAVTTLIALILLLIGFFWKRLINLSSWFVAVRIHGDWETELARTPAQVNNTPCEDTNTETPNPKQNHPHEDARLHQFFNKVWGTAQRHSDSNITYKLRGQIIGEKLSMVYREIDGFDSGAILLDIKSRRLMKGFEIGRNLDNGDTYSCPYLWRRRK